MVVPTTLKKVVSQYAPMFAGHQQHDASELMSFLLDGIHEDLNRVHKKVFTDRTALFIGRRKNWSSVHEGCHRAVLTANGCRADLVAGCFRFLGVIADVAAILAWQGRVYR